MKKHVLTALALAAASLISTQAFAQAKEGPWMVRARAVSLTSANTDSTGLGLTVNDIVLPEVDVSYFFSPNLAVELILTVPQQHDVKSNGTKIGTLSQLPPTLLAQYHFPMNGFKPYVGAGINYTKFTTSDIALGSIPVTTDSSSWGGALQVGVDVPLSGNMYFNFDVKKVFIKTNINAGGNSVGTLKVDPLLVGVGIGWRF
jgi:outer membrane protein